MRGDDDLKLTLLWDEKHADGTAAEATRGALLVQLGKRILWGDGRAGIRWTWVDLLEHLARSWAPLLVEEADPIGLDVPPARLWDAAQERWAGDDDEDRRDREEKALHRFDVHHDLANALPGAAPPRLFLIRQGATMLIASEGTFLARRSFSAVMTKLEGLGERIAERLGGVDDRRARSAVDAWKARSQLSEERFVMLATGFERQRLADIERASSLADPWGIERLAPLVPLDPIERHHDSTTPQLSAARMLGSAAPIEVVARVLTWISQLQPARTPALDELGPLAERELGTLATTNRAAWEQGERLALWLRGISGHSLQDRIDPSDLLRRFGVLVDSEDLGWEGIDAVACWGENRGPAILVNTAGKRAQGEEGRRSTLAHELCHLLVDRHHTLPMAEVLRGRAPADTEARANAFAAGLLLPRGTAGDALATAKTKADAARTVSDLRTRYGASAQIIAWQAVRSEGRRLRPPVIAHLQQLVPARDQDSFLRAAERHRR